MSTTTPGSNAALQNLRVAPMGQSLDDPETLAGSGMYVMLDGRLRAQREQETREAVERLRATSRSGTRKAWGAGSSAKSRKGLRTGKAGVGTTAADVRASVDASSPARTAHSQSHAQSHAAPAASSSAAVDAAYVRRLEQEMRDLQRTVTDLQQSQQSVGVEPGFLSKIDQLRQDHSKNVATIERLFKQKQVAERRAQRLEAKLRSSGGKPVPEHDGGRSDEDDLLGPPPPAAAESKSADGYRRRPSQEKKGAGANPWGADRYEDEGGFDFSGGQQGGDESAPPGPDDDYSAHVDPHEDDDLLDVPARAKIDSPRGDNAQRALAASQDDLSWARRVRDVYLSSDRSRSSSSGGAAASGRRRRPQSAGPGGRRPSKTTQPKPFMMTVRDSTKHLNRRQQELEEKRRAELEAQEEEEKLRLRRSRGGPFTGLMQREEERQRRAALRDAKRKEEERLANSRRFKANPVPRTMVSEDYSVRKEAEERARRERIAKRSQELLSKSQMPPRMKLREVSTKQQRAASKVKEDAKPSTAPPKPRKVPDFERLKRKWEHKLTAVRMKNASTQPQPFAMEERQRFHDSKREERARKRQEKEEEEARAEAERERRRRAAAMRAGPKGTQATTKSVELRMQAVKKAEEQKAMELEATERAERARKAKQERASRELRPVIAAMEKERKELMQGDYVELQNVVPDADGELPEQARALVDQQQRAFREKRTQNKRQIADAIKQRPTLFERSEIQRRSEDAKRKALATIAQNVYSSGPGASSAAWRQMAADDDLLDDEEKELMGLTAGGGAAEDEF